jgi:hypothetical protein
MAHPGWLASTCSTAALRFARMLAEDDFVRNRPADRLRGELFHAWMETAARSWPVFPAIAAVAVPYVLFLTLLPTPPWWGGFCAGLLVGALSVAAMWLVHLYSGSHNALFGTLGEQATADVLQSRRMRRSGWRLVNGLAFANHGDVDHTLVGPGGIFAVESKWTNQSWEFDSKGRIPALERALIQARLGARRITSTLRAHHVASQSAVYPAIVIWGPGAPIIAGGLVELDGVAVFEGRKLRSWPLGSEDTLLSPDDVESVFRALLGELSSRQPVNLRQGVATPT